MFCPFPSSQESKSGFQSHSLSVGEEIWASVLFTDHDWLAPPLVPLLRHKQSDIYQIFSFRFVNFPLCNQFLVDVSLLKCYLVQLSKVQHNANKVIVVT